MKPNTTGTNERRWHGPGHVRDREHFVIWSKERYLQNRNWWSQQAGICARVYGEQPLYLPPRGE